MKQKIIGTGLSGLVGSRIVELLDEDFIFEDLSRRNGIHIENKNEVLEKLKQSDAQFVLHLAAYTQVDEAEKEKALKKESIAWKINVEGTRNVVEACQQTGKRLIHFSTDMVFPGTKPLPERYVEDDITQAVGWYAKTKEEAEKVVQSSQASWTILRIAYPYRASFEKKEYVRVFQSLLEQGKSIQAVADHYFTPTFIDDIAEALKVIFQKNITGIYHIGGKEVVSPYEVSKKVAQVFGLNAALISKTTREEYFKGKAPRAFNLSLNSDRIEKLGVKLKSLEEGLEEMRKQLT